MEKTVSNLQLYTLLYVTINGTLLLEEHAVTINRNSHSQPVNTTAKGYAGESPGAPMCEFDVSNAIPANGFEFDAGMYIFGLIKAEIGVLGPGGTTLRDTGFIISDTIKHSVNSESNYDFKMRAPIAMFS
jgi:hypothetical protein